MLELCDLAYEYQSGTPFATTAVRQVDLCVPAGELLALVGPARSGKSTLAQLGNGLLAPTRGIVRVDGMPLGDDASRRTARAKVGLVMQYPEAQLFASTVGEDVAFGPRNFGVSDVDDAVDSALTAVGLAPQQYRQRGIEMLSGGQRRRVAIAGVLACRPRYLIADEPTAGLDPDGRRAMLDLLRGLADTGIGVLLASGSLAALAEHADRVAVLEDGALSAFGEPEQILADDALVVRSGIGRPAVWETLDALARRGYPVRPAVCSVREAAALVDAALGKR